MYVSKKVFEALEVAIEALESGSEIFSESDRPSNALDILLEFRLKARQENKKRKIIRRF